MQNQIRIILSVIIVMALLLGSGLPFGEQPAAADGEGQDLPPLELPEKGNPKLDSQLNQLVSAQTSKRAASFAQESNIELVDGNVRVIVECLPDEVDAAVKAAGASGVVETSYRNLLQVVVPINNLTALADTASIRLVRLPWYPLAADNVSEGVALINADEWQTVSYNGTGVKVAIVDLGFSGYTTRQSEGELPATVNTWWAPSIGGPGTSVHGTACAEIVYDIAPDADFYLVNLGTEVETGNALDWLIAQGVDVISCSVGWPIYGPGDGTGPICEMVDDARAAGILWSQAIGNYGQSHWKGNWADSNSNYLLDFIPGVDELIAVYLYPEVPISIDIKWNDPWGTSSNDYDLLLFNDPPTWPQIAGSYNVQDGLGGNDYPVEGFDYTATSEGWYYIAIGQFSATGISSFHLYTYPYDIELQHQVASGSYCIPADSPNATAVGAVPWNNPTALEPFSSQGPTTDNRTKPDLVAPDGVSTATYGATDFYGTSASAPHVAGAAVLVKELYPSYTPAQIQAFLEARAVDLGDPDKDNLYGSGRLDLGSPPPTMEPIAEAEGQYYNTAPILSNFGFDDDEALDDGWYQMDSYTGSWTSLFTDNGSSSWDYDNWPIPDFGALSEGSHTIYFKASDNATNVVGDSGEWNWQFYKDTAPPTDPTSVSSTSHTISVWSSDNTVDISWTDATDNLSGLDGYSILWNTDNSTIPDDTKDIEEESENTTSLELAEDNSHYFHIRSVDNLGNWQSTVHVGPFFIDTTPPPNPTSVSSTSHTLSTWSNDTTVDITWTDATDNLSGLDGYSILWNTDNSTIPDDTKDIEEESENTTSLELAEDNSHYFHIRSVDNAGNWQSTVHLGPFFIDTTWTVETIPSATGKMVVAGSDVSDFAVASDNTTIYAVDKARDKIYKSTNAGVSWTELTNPTDATEPQLVAVASDNTSIVAIVADNNEVYVTTDGGTSWDSLDIPQETGGGAAATALYDITIAAAIGTPSVNYIAVAGIESGPLANVWYYDLLAASPVWKETNDLYGFGATSVNTTAAAVAFSPNFPLDMVMAAITEEDDGSTSTGPDYVRFEIFSFNYYSWNTGAFDYYPATIVSDDGITGLDSASISMAPDYHGAWDTRRDVFVGLAVAGDADAAATSGIYRLNDDNVTALKTGKQIHSIAYDGTRLVAGEYDSQTVRRSDDPLGLIPDPSTDSSVTNPGGENKAVIAWAGSNVLAGTSGSASAFAVSTDNGTTFTDISLTVSGTDVSDFAVASDNTTVYATDKEADKLYRSPNTGVSWTEVTVIEDINRLNAELVAVAPDDPNFIAVSGNATIVFVSDDAGANWDTLGPVTGLDSINDLALSVAKGGEHFVAVAGEDGGVAEVWYYEIGAVGAAWWEASAEYGFNAGDAAVAVAFSPNFASDEVMVAITEDDDGAGGSDYVSFQIYSFEHYNWNTGTFADYPVTIVSDDGITGLDSASISLAPDYLGIDGAKRIAFIGLTVAGDVDAVATSGIYRLKDDTLKVLKTGVKIHSVAFDGTNLVAGEYDTTTVWRSANPLATSGAVLTAQYRKRPGGQTDVVVAWAGSDVVAGTSGDESAFAVSKNNGESFNDISLIDTTLTTLEDVAVSADGSKVFLLTNDGTTTSNSTAKDLSVWRLASSWERVLSIAINDTTTAKKPYIIRMAPDNSDVLYVAQHGVTHARITYYTTTGGETEWFARVSRYDIQDLAVESADVAYIAVDGTRSVSKSTNGGFTWGTRKDTGLAGAKMLVPTGVTEPQLVAVAPDDANYIAIVADDNEVYISDDGGLGWDTLELEYSVTSTFIVRDIALSVAKQEWPWLWGNHFVAVAGEDGGVAEVWYYEIGAVGAAWIEASAKTGFDAGDVAGAVAFSPYFASDQVMVAITENDDGAGGTDNVSFQIFSFSQDNWNTGTFAGYPVTIASDDGITGLDSASISLAPDYLGTDNTTRISFVGLTVAGDNDAVATSGIYRLEDVTLTELKTGEQIHSVAFNGTNLVAGEYDSTDVWRSANPMETTPTVNITAPSDRPGGENKVVVAWAGSDVVAGTSGNESAFAISSDNGTTFTDISLTDTGTDVSDFAVASNNTTIYATDKESDKLYKSINAGVSWTEAQDTPLPNGHMIVSLGVDKLLVSSTDGYVAYSTDGNSSWTRFNQQIESGALLTQVTASGLASSDYIYAASSKADTKVLRWQVGTSTNWTDMAAPTTAGYEAYGIALHGGVLYVANSDATANSEVLRTSDPTASTVSWSTLASPGKTFIRSPSALRVSTGSTKLWVIDTTTAALFSYSISPPTPPPTGGGGGGGGGGGAAGVTPILNFITQKGRFVEDVTCKSEDKKVELFIPEDTIGLNRVGSLISSIRIKQMEESPTPPEQTDVIGLVYDIDPFGATFDPPIDLTIKYDESKIPEGVAEKNLVVAWWDKNTSQWVELESTVDPENDTITAKVSHFTAFTILAYTRPASFTVTDLSLTPGEVNLGERVSVSVIITNNGDLTGSYELSLEIDNTVVQTKEVTLDGGDIETISFSVTPDAVGEHTVNVSGLPGTLKVKAPEAPPALAPAPAVAPAPASFVISDLSVTPGEVKPAEQVKISAVVTNTGGSEGNYTVVLKINGAEEARKEVALGAGKSETVTFTIAKDTEGSYAVTINGKVGQFNVIVPPPPTPTPTEALPVQPPTNWWLIGGIIAGCVVVAAGLLVYFFVWRKRGAARPS